MPASGTSSPTAIDRAVVLPAPLGPTSPKNDPGGTAGSEVVTAVVSPNRFTNPTRLQGGWLRRRHAVGWGTVPRPSC